jgi:DNA polymerase-3 subunit epsilon
MRHIVLDTETTGFDAEGEDRILEIGAVELVNYVPTGQVYHQYINPERLIPENVTAIHGIKDSDVADKPVFAEIVDDFQKFIGEDTLVIHNAEFDMRFINAEFKRVGFTALPFKRAQCTLVMARKLFPGAPNSLDALCKRYNVDNSKRIYHGALMDARLLCDVFLELAGGRQPDLIGGSARDKLMSDVTDDDNLGVLWPAREFPLSATEKNAHEKMLEGIKDPIWVKAS